MRFCMVTTFYPPYHFGGDATYVRALARGLVARGHSVDVVHCIDAFKIGGGTPSTQLNDEDGVNVHSLKSAMGLLSPLLTQQLGHPALKHRKLKRLLENDYDVIHYHNISLVGGPGVLSLGQAPVKLYTLHEHWLLCAMHTFWKYRRQVCDKRECIRCCVRSGIPPQLWRYTNFINRQLQHVDCLLAPSDYTAERHRRGGITAPIKTLPLFSSLDPPLRPRVPHDGPAYFVFAGRVTAEKGIDELLQIIGKYPRFRLLVIGEGDLLTTLERDYKSYPHIEFLGPLAQESLVDYYRNALALIYPSSVPETFGLSVVEAFACATPAVVRRAGATPEIIESSEAGYVYDSEQELISALDKLVSQRELRERLGENARQAHEDQYRAEHHFDRYLKNIDEFMNHDAGDNYLS
ncbi:MAG: glycosyltransferase family 4 protein [Pseudomonadota bacterium]